MGHFVFTWLGWVTGFILIKVPWGPPSFKSWISWITFWSAFVISIQHILLVDFSRQTKLADALAINLLAKKIHDIVLVVAFFAFWSVRLVFLIHAKKFVNLLNIFYEYPLQREYSRWKIAWRLVIFCICLSSILLISSAGTFILAVRGKVGQNTASWFYISGQVLSGIIGGFFGHISSMSATNISFAVVTYVSFYLGMIYCDFCNELKEYLKLGNNNTIIFSKEFAIVRHEQHFKKAIFHHNTNNSPALSKEILLNKFEGVRSLFEIGNKIVSPLALIIIVVETFRGVSLAHEMLINKLGGLFLLDNYLNVTQQIIHAGIIFVGQYVQDMMNERKKELVSFVTLIEEISPDQQCSIKLTRYVVDFEWRLSAFGFFHVDKKLLSGMMATAATYIVILVQLQISLYSSACLTRSVILTSDTNNATQIEIG